MRDRLFEKGEPAYESFEFTEDVVQVFDDMVVRSVPHYEAVQDLIVELALRCHGGRPIYDLGCSTGNTLIRLARRSQDPLLLVGVDNSPAMLSACSQKLAEVGSHHTIHLLAQDLSEMRSLPLGEAGVVILSLVSQFLRPLRRQELISRIYQQLAPGGCLLLLEKTVEPEAELNRMFVDLHHEFKRSCGYSEWEIRRKREALENRLIPFQSQENLEILRQVGFKASIFYTWLNFQGYIGLKVSATGTGPGDTCVD